jgi:hypothetical protein
MGLPRIGLPPQHIPAWGFEKPAAISAPRCVPYLKGSLSAAVRTCNNTDKICVISFFILLIARL